MNEHSRKNQKGATAIIIAMMMLVGLLGISLALSAVVIADLRISTDQLSSTKALYAAESGLEKILYEIRIPPVGYLDLRGDVNCDGYKCVNFATKTCEPCGNSNRYDLGDTYYQVIATTTPDIERYYSTGYYKGVGAVEIMRAVEASY